MQAKDVKDRMEIKRNLTFVRQKNFEERVLKGDRFEQTSVQTQFYGVVCLNKYREGAQRCSREGAQDALCAGG